MYQDFYQLPNGLAIVGERDADARSTTVGFWVKTGARDETLDVSGVSHFLEHMMFKGTARRSPEQINLEFDAMGARYNAFTSEEETVFYGAVLPEFGPRILELLADMMRPALRLGDFDLEKKVIIEEIAMYDDRPMSQLWDALKTQYYGAHPLGQSVIGTVQSITDLSRDAMMNYFENRYAPQNTALVVTGQYDFDAIVAGAVAACGDWKTTEAPRVYSDVKAGSGINIVTKPEVSRAHIGLMGPGLSTQDSRRYAASLACEIVGGGAGSRLHWALVHPGLAEAASMGHDSQDGAGAFYRISGGAPRKSLRSHENLARRGRKSVRERRHRRRIATRQTQIRLGADAARRNADGPHEARRLRLVVSRETDFERRFARANFGGFGRRCQRGVGAPAVRNSGDCFVWAGRAIGDFPSSVARFVKENLSLASHNFAHRIVIVRHEIARCGARG